MGFTESKSGGMDPVTEAALITAIAQIGGKFLPGGKETAEQEEGHDNRQLTRQENLIELVLKAAKIADQNMYDKDRATRMAPMAARTTEMRMAPSKGTELRNQGVGRMNAAQPGGGDPGIASLVNRNFAQYAQERSAAKQAGQTVTPESLYTPQSDPLQAVRSGAPEAYRDMAELPTYSNRSGDGLDDVEVLMLNKRQMEGATPEELSKMLATFRRKEVKKGVANG